MNPYEEYLKQKQIEDVDLFFKTIGITPNIYGDLSMSPIGKQGVLRAIAKYRDLITFQNEKIEEIKSRKTSGPAPRKSKYDSEKISTKEKDIEKIFLKIKWIKFHVMCLGWDITDKEMKV